MGLTMVTYFCTPLAATKWPDIKSGVKIYHNRILKNERGGVQERRANEDGDKKQEKNDGGKSAFKIEKEKKSRQNIYP